MMVAKIISCIVETHLKKNKKEVFYPCLKFIVGKRMNS